MQSRRDWLIWPGLLILGPLTIAFVYLAHAQGWALVSRESTEWIAPWIPAAAALVFSTRALLLRNPLYLLMAGFGASACLRELHYDWTHHGVYYMLVVLMLLAWVWRERIVPLARQGAFMAWFKATMASYLLAVLLARRAFKHILPYEEDVNTQLEESMENVAHALLLLSSLAGQWRTQAATSPVKLRQESVLEQR